MRAMPLRLEDQRFVKKDMLYWTTVYLPFCSFTLKKHLILFVLVVLFFSGCTSSASLPSASKLSVVPGAVTEFLLQCEHLRGTPPTAPCVPRDPISITAGPDGNLWFTEFTTARIGRITPSGTITEFPFLAFNPSAGATDITSGPDGNLWFTYMNVIGRITPRGSITMFPLPGSNPLLVSAASITAGPDGNLWFTEYGSDNIGRITPHGSITLFPFSTYSNGLGGIAAGPDGNLWFTAPTAIDPASGRFVQPGRIGRITPSGTITTFPLPASDEPGEITVGPDGNLWFTETIGETVGDKIEYYSIGKIGRIAPSGPITTFPLPASDTPGEIAAGPDGNLWFTEYGKDNIARITPRGLVTQFFLPIPRFAGIAAGPDGNLWFAGADSNRIGCITVDKLNKQT